VKVAYSAFLYGLGAADNEFLVRRKIDKAEHEERDRRLRELLLLQGHDEAFVRNISFFLRKTTALRLPELYCIKETKHEAIYREHKQAP